MVRLIETIRVHTNYVILLFGAFTYLLQNFVWFSFPALLPKLLEDIHLTSTEVGMLNGTIPLIFIFLSIAIGVAIDRFGGQLSIGIALFVFGFGQLFRSFAGDFWALFGTTVLIGVGAAGISIGLPKIVAAYFPANRSGSMSSGYLLGAQIGSTIAYLLARPYLSPLLGGWRPVFFWSGVVVIGTALVWLPTVRYLHRVHVRTRETGPGTRAEGWVDEEVPQETFESSLRADLTVLLNHRDLQLLVIIGTMLLALSHGLRGWLPIILETNGFSASVAASIVTVLVVGQMTGVLSIPPLSDRLGKRRSVIVACGTLAMFGTVGVFYTLPVLLMATAVFVVGVGIGGISPLVRALPIEMDEVGPKLTATAVGLIFTVGQIGGFLAPFLIGFLEDVYGSFSQGLLLLIACAFVLIVSGVLIGEPNSERENADSLK